MRHIVANANFSVAQSEAVLSLLFQPGERPSASDVETLLATSNEALRSIQISHRPDDAEGWLELLSNGLTFDLMGLTPAHGMNSVPIRQHFGLPESIASFEFEAITLRLGPHIAAGAAMIPVVRVMMALAMQLSEGLSARVVCWHPCGSWMDPRYFGRIIENWLFGGAFPALGLTNIISNTDGSVTSQGLGFFVGQELTVVGQRSERTADVIKMAVRTIDYMTRNGPFESGATIEGPDSEMLRAEVSGDRRQVRISRSTA